MRKPFWKGIIFFLGFLLVGVGIYSAQDQVLGLGVGLVVLAVAGEFVRYVIGLIILAVIIGLLLPVMLPIIIAVAVILGVLLAIITDGLDIF